MEDGLILRNHLAQVRKEKGLSQAELAKLVGVSRNTISSIETGQFSPTAKLALIICIALDMKFEELFYFRNRTAQTIHFREFESICQNRKSIFFVLH